MIKNIAFIYEYGDEIWSTPYSLIKEFQRRGYKVDRYHLSDPDKTISTDINYDIVIVLDWKGIDISNNIKKILKSKGTFLIRECGDTPQNYDKHLKCANGYDLLLTPDYQSVIKYNQAGYNCIQFQHFADTDIHKIYEKLASDNLPPVRSTRGLGGSSFMDHLSNIMSDKFINRNGLTGEDYGKFLSGGLITFQNSRWKEITRRIFEGMACGKMVLTDRLPNETYINDYFIENEDIVYYDNIPDAISKINYYLSESGKIERERIAHNGYIKVIKHHTQINRIDIILEQYQKTFNEKT